MAQIQFSEIGITDIRGRIAGTQFTRVMSGPQAIRPTIPRQPGTPPQEFSQYLFQQVLGAWKDISEGERGDWATAALLPDWERVNRLGETYQPTGQSLFIQLNLSAFKQSFPITSPPTFPSFTAVTFDSMSANVTEKMDLEFSTGTISSDEVMIMYATAQLSRGRMSTSQREYFLIDNADEITFQSTYDAGPQYITRWGELREGLKVFVRCELLNWPSGARQQLGIQSAVIEP